MFPVLIPPRHLFIATLVVFGVLFSSPMSLAASQTMLKWKDNSTNEDGFVLERRPGTGGTYAPVAQVGKNVTSYIDKNVVAGSRYCYRVQSFNDEGTSPYSNEACRTVATTDTSTLVSISLSVVGQGKVISDPPGISCAPTCEKGFPLGAMVDLTATSTTGGEFQGWGGSCTGKATTCSLTIDQVKNVTANFVRPSGSNGGSTTHPIIGTFRNGSWRIDNGNWTKDSCTVDTCPSFGVSGDLPVIGYWVKGGKKQIGVFRKGTWYVDTNGNGLFDGCAGGDTCFSFGSSNHQAVVGDLNGDGQSEVGLFLGGRWYFDTGNRRWDGCKTDTCISGFGLTGDQPVVGDWNGDGRSDVGVFRNGNWYLDYNGNRKLDECGIDKCLRFGSPGDRAVVGDWNGDGKTQIGVFRRGEWYLDNGDGVLDTTCSVDTCVKGFGTDGDIPISK